MKASGRKNSALAILAHFYPLETQPETDRQSIVWTARRNKLREDLLLNQFATCDPSLMGVTSATAHGRGTDAAKSRSGPARQAGGRNDKGQRRATE